MTCSTNREKINDIIDHTVDETFAALADPTRRRIVELLQSGPRRAGTIAEDLGTSRAASSRHLRQLDAAGIVDVAPDPDDARGRIYELRMDRLIGLSAWLDQVEAHWNEQLQSFRVHVERTRPQ